MTHRRHRSTPISDIGTREARHRYQMEPPIDMKTGFNWHEKRLQRVKSKLFSLRLFCGYHRRELGSFAYFSLNCYLSSMTSKALGRLLYDSPSVPNAWARWMDVSFNISRASKRPLESDNNDRYLPINLVISHSFIIFALDFN